MRRAQTDIIGVVIIVILLIIGGVFMITQRMRASGSQTRSFIDPKLSQSFLNSLMNTKTYKSVLVSDVIKDCFSNRNDLCGETSDCCQYAETVMSNALTNTLAKWKKPYRLTVTKEGAGQKIQTIATPGCDSFSEKEQPGFYYIPPSPPIVVRLDVCK
ncbi:MAG: hypothetical protein ABIJ34_00650 [archaeon]